MNRREARAFIDAVVALRGIATDEQALAASAAYPAWRAEQSYQLGERVLYNKVLYKVVTAHISQSDWAPDVAPSLFAKVLIEDPNVISAWEQPDSTNPYMSGDRVSHNGKKWTSIVDNNVWEPGAYGWEEIVE